MATYLRNSVLVSSLMFFVVIGSLNAQKADVNAICGKAKNPTFCTNYMKANPEASTADVKTLAQMTLASAQASAAGASAKIESLAKTATDPALKQGYTACVGQYKDAMSSLNEAKQSLTSNDGQGLNMKVSAAMTGATECQDGLAKNKADPAAVKNSDDFQNICGIVLVLSNMMGKA